MARVRRTRTLAAPPEVVWRTVGDPRRLSRWWPKVRRVETAGDGRFTEVLRTERGREVRADFIVLELREPEGWRAAQELEGTPFAGVLHHAEKAVGLRPAADGGTELTIELDRRMRGLARLGGPLGRRASARQIDAAFDTLEGIHGTRP